MGLYVPVKERQWLHSSVGGAWHRYREVTGSNPAEVLNFFSGFFTQLHKLRSLRRSFLHLHYNLCLFLSKVTGKEDKKQMSLEFISIIQDDDEDKMVCENVKKEQVQANMEMIPLLQDNNEVVKEGVVLNFPNLSDVRRKYQNR